ncbi:uncharacterized protein LOC103961527 isoform X5 [Pyrus x bretschneideri]|uniref:uncharacterized protein LOC103961527 isoform X5 n=1 Tax=Pyrus x bretschneideri TaxID=225117 RepID=UPI0020309A70|nr:uncharacterized protein LOC103961527 isoform X5 [Pyrus x bretschneideri]
METVVGVEGNDEGMCEESGVEKSSSSLSSPKQIADPVVYKLVRVEGDGRLVPATDDDVMEVEDFLVDETVELPVITEAGNGRCISNEESSSGKPQKESSEEQYISRCLTFREHRADVKLSARLEDIVPSSSLSPDGSHINESGRIGECSKQPLDGPIESGSSASVICTGPKPDVNTLKGEICLDNLSIRELHELFRATFGRETTVKDKLWLKRRITMALTNSCDVSTTTFTIVDNKLVNKGKDDSIQNADGMHKLVNKGKDDSIQNADGMLTEGSDGEAKNLGYETSPTSHSSKMENHVTVSGKRFVNISAELDCGSEDLHTDQRAAKRIRKPTKRYIEELSEVESKDCSPKVTSPVKSAGQRQTSPKSCRPLGNVPLNERAIAIRLDPLGSVTNVPPNERTFVTRLDSLGGSGVQVPYVSRVRRSRPRKNIMALMKFDMSGMGVTAKLVKEAFSVRSSVSESEHVDKVLKVRSASERMKPRCTAEPEKDKRRSVMGTIEPRKNLGIKQTDSSEDNSDDGTAQIPTAKGGMRRKHHRAWTLVEVIKLVEGVSKCGTGRWSEIKRLSFASYSYRTSVDLKDKWRNLLKASVAQTPPDDGINSRKHASVPIPASILLKVRQLAEMQVQVPPNLGPSKLATVSSRSVHQMRPGFL